MNDDFLTRFRKPPPRAFAMGLYKRINIPMHTPRNFGFRPFTFAAAICLAIVAALIFLPAARATFNGWIRQIGGITYFEQEDIPGQPTLSESEITLVPEEWLSLEQARMRVPFDFYLPEWTPAGYTMSRTVRVSYFPDRSADGTNPFIFISWVKAQDTGGGSLIELVLAENAQWLVDLDHLQEVPINGQPAGLTGGGWSADTGDWDTSHGDLTLTWRWHGIMYQLRSTGATVEELIQVAESIP